MTKKAKLPMSPARRVRMIAVAAYAAGAIISVAWGVSYDLLYDQGLRGEVRLGATGEGSTFITIHNDTPFDWTNVKVEADSTWFYRFDVLPHGSQSDARLREFENGYRLPRPEGVFFWEAVGPAPEPFGAPSDLRPTHVRLTCDQGTFETEVSL